MNLLNSYEAAEWLRMRQALLLRLARAGVIPHIALPDGELRFHVGELDEWMANSRRSVSTPPQLAARWGLSPTKVLAWIRAGELVAFDASTKRGGRPRFLIDETAIKDFEAQRSTAVKPQRTASSGRGLRRKDPNVIEFF